MAKYLDSTGLTYLWAKIKTWVGNYVKLSNGKITIGENEITPITDISGKVDKTTTVNGHALSSNVTVTKADVGLGNVTDGAEINQNAYSDITVMNGQQLSRLSASTKTDTFGLVAGNNVSLSTNNSIITIGVATGAIPGASSTTPAMDGTAAAGTETTWAHGDHVHPSDTSKVNVSAVGVASGVASLDANTKVPVAQLPVVTTSANGAMSSDDKTKLDGIATGAEVNQNAFSSIIAQGAQISADSKTTSLYLGYKCFYVDSDGRDRKVSLYVVTAKGGSPSNPIYTGREVTEIVGYSYAQDLYDSDAHTSGKDSSILTLGGYYGLLPKVFASPAFTGTPTAPTAAAGTNTTQVATTAFVTSAVSAGSSSITNMIGAASGICPLDANTKIDAQYLPSYVDDVVEAYARTGQTALTSTWLATGSASGTTITPEAGKIYVLMADSGDYTANSQFRWGGSAYVKLNDGGVSAITNAEIDAIVAN